MNALCSFPRGGTARPSLRYRVHRFLLATLFVLGCTADVGCGDGGDHAFDAFGAYNTQGGGRRSNDFARSGPGPVSGLRAFRYDNLRNGLQGPPLELSSGALAFVARNDSSTRLAVVRRESVLWTFAGPAGRYLMSDLACDSAGVLFAATTRGHMYSFDSAGRRIAAWTICDTAAAVTLPSPPLALNTGVIVGNAQGRIARYTAAGRTVWSVQRGASASAAPAGEPGLGIAVALSHNSFDAVDTLLLLDPATGHERWARPAEARIVQGPMIVDGLIVVGVVRTTDEILREPMLMAFTSSGTVAWRARLPLMPRGICGTSGEIYVSCSGASETMVGGAMVALDTAGRRRWQATFGSPIPASAVVTANWVCFISRRDGRTGLFTYGRDGTFRTFVAIDVLPDVHASMMVTSVGELMLAALDEPALLRGE